MEMKMKQKCHGLEPHARWNESDKNTNPQGQAQLCFLGQTQTSIHTTQLSILLTKVEVSKQLNSKNEHVVIANMSH